ncbi:MAG: hypothetical protein QM775_14660 [Pirellulales bacterium]
MNLSTDHESTQDAPPTAAAADVLAVFVVLALLGIWPTPDINEAHYLTKAKHFWQPHWCANDHFLASGESHVTYYATFGYLTQLMSFDAAAWCGRLAGWLMLAIGWRRLSFVFARDRHGRVVHGGRVALDQQFQMSGEWFVGGIEAKVPAYALVFYGLADVFQGAGIEASSPWARRRHFTCSLGGWSLVAVGTAWLADRQRPALRSILPGLVVAGLLSLAGVLPGLAEFPPKSIPPRSPKPINSTSSAAWPIIFGRSTSFPSSPPDIFLLIVGWLVVCGTMPSSPQDKRLRWFVAAAIALALVGAVISYASPAPSNWAARLLKYYWFRLSDIAVPIGVTLELARAAANADFSPLRRRLSFALLTAAAVWGGVQVVSELHSADVRPMRSERIDDAVTYANWQAACRWIRDNTPDDAIVITPRTAS